MSMPKKLLLYGILVLIVLVVAGAFFYKSVQQKHWLDMTDATAMAEQKASIKQVTRVEPSYGDDAYHIVFGHNEAGEALVAWVSETEVHVEKADGAFTEEQARAAVIQAEPGATILRVLPNRIQSEYVWEVFYKKSADMGDDKYFYKYFRFTDGAHIDTYKLSL